MHNRAARDGQGRASRAQSHPARQRTALWMSSLRALLDATLLKERGGDATMHPPTGGRAAPSLSAAPTQTPSAPSWGRGDWGFFQYKKGSISQYNISLYINISYDDLILYHVVSSSVS